MRRGDTRPGCCVLRRFDFNKGAVKMFRYVHTDIVAKDAGRLIAFYKEVLHCRSIGETRDLRGAWLDKLTGLPGAHITGEHLLLPGYGEDHPTLEIFQYGQQPEGMPPVINRPGFAHIAFEVDDVRETLNAVLREGGGQYGELVTTVYPGGVEAAFVYASDPEGNVIELQSWKKP